MTANYTQIEAFALTENCDLKPPVLGNFVHLFCKHWLPFKRKLCRSGQTFEFVCEFVQFVLYATRSLPHYLFLKVVYQGSLKYPQLQLNVECSQWWGRIEILTPVPDLAPKF